MLRKSISGSVHLKQYFAFAALFATFGASGSVRAADWSAWRGPNGDFTADATPLAASWPTDGPVKVWERDLGAGYSGIAAVGGQLFTMYRDGDADVVVALDAQSGKTLWEHKYSAPPLEKQSKEFGTGPNSTPLVLDDRVITVGFTGALRCLDRSSGKLLWSKDLVKGFGGKVQEFGYSASPMLYKGNVILLVGGERSGVVSLKPADGSRVWESGALDISYATPVFINVDGQDQMVVMTSTEVVGMSPDGGDVLWRHPCMNRYKNNATDPIWYPEKNLLWVATQLDGGTRVLHLSHREGTTEVTERWINDKVKIFHWNAVRIGDHVYGSIGGHVTMMAGVDMTTGEIKWRERGFHKALCVLSGSRVIFLDENGTLAMGDVSPDRFNLRGKVDLTTKVSWTVPTLVDGTLFVRDTKKIMALDVRKR